MKQLLLKLDCLDSNEIAHSKQPIGEVAKSIKKPNRDQIEFKIGAIDDLIPSDHKVRYVWDYIQQMDLSSFYNKIKLPLGCGGPRTTDPRVLICLWLYALLEGNNSARSISNLTKNHHAYIWICGGMPVNYHTISDFRSKNSDGLKLLFQESIAILWTTGKFNPVTGAAQDGTRVKASAGGNSSRRGPKLQQLLNEAKEYLETLEKEHASNACKASLHQKSAKQRAAIERKNVLEKAITELNEYKNFRKESGIKNHHRLTEKELNETRVSTTDPECRKMKMGDGGFRNAYNIQFAASVDKQVIIGVDVVKTLDSGTVGLLLKQVSNTLNCIGCSMPSKWLADSAYANKIDAEEIETNFANVKLYSPPTGNKKCDALSARKTDNEGMRKLRQRMSEPESKVIYQDRSKTIEFVNAVTKNRGMKEMLVKGLNKVKNMALLYAVCHNMMIFFRN